MNVFGRYSYYNSQEIKPGGLYIASRDDDVCLVLGVEPAMKGDATAILIIKRITGSAFTSDFLVIYGESFAKSSKYMLLKEAQIVPDLSLDHWRMTQRGLPDIGSLYCFNEKLLIVARDGDGNIILVNCKDGATETSGMTQCFWTRSWSIQQRDANDRWVDIYKL